jgi:hypothetical protein
MTRTVLPLVVLAMLLGCNRAGEQAAAPASGTSGGAPPAAAAAPAPPPTSITNRFGMTFKLVSVEPKPAGLGDTGKFGLAFLKQSYYLGQAEVTQAQFMAFHKAATERDKHLSSHKKPYYNFPGEWQFAHNFGIELSKLDPDYDYRLPTREEWSFACLNGYDQDCPQPYPDGPIIKVPPDRRPNKYGIDGLTNYDLECGNLEGLHFGLSGFRPPPEELACPCGHYGYGNPEGDDGLNDIIYARYVLTPKAK